MQTRTGIGPALSEAREFLGKSLDEAARDTRIRPEYLEALEGEDFDALHGEVYARGFLRSYSSYLGLDPDRVIAAYDEAGPPAPVTPPGPEVVPNVHHGGIRGLHRRANWKLAAALAVGLIVLFGALGLLSRKSPVPAAGAVPTNPPLTAQQATAGNVTLVLSAPKTLKHPISVVVVVDGVRQRDGNLKPGHSVGFIGHSLIRVQVSRGDAIDFVVNGHDLGTPGSGAGAYRASFSPQDFRGTPSANGG